MTGPVVEMERLILAPHTLEDFADSAAMWADPDVTRFIGGRPFAEDECWARLHRYAGHWALMGYGYWAVREKDSGRFVGEIGLMDFKRDIDPPFNGAPEAGWAFRPQAHGKGYATEALAAVHAWAEAKWGAVRTVCMIAPENAASIRVAEKAGYREYCRTSFKGAPTTLFERG